MNVQPNGVPSYQLKTFKYNSHYWILKFLADAPVPSRILDVGTAGGYLGQILQQQGHVLVGIESDSQAVQNARAYYDHVHVANVENFALPYRNEFDFMVFADVLEHLRDPAGVLRNWLSALKEKTGQVIVSVPNVANLIIRLSLLSGRFEYADRGIMDRSHLRFFTMSSLQRMLSDCGLAVVDIVAAPLPVQLVFPITDSKWFAPLHELHQCVVRMRKPLFAYQFIIKAKRKDGR